MHLGLVLIRYSKVTGREIAAFQGSVLPTIPQRTDYIMPMGHLGKEQGQSGGRSERKAWAQSFVVAFAGRNG